MYLLVLRAVRLLIPKVPLLLFSQLAFSQDHSSAGWAAWFNGVRIKESRWGLHSDVQLRTGNDWHSSATLLIRPGINYHLTHNQTISAGYAATLTTGQTNGITGRLGEHRIWEQYALFSKLLGIPVQHRFRLEQRFLRRADETVFAQRARYFIRGIIPLQQPVEEPLARGGFVSLQNELFFNIQHRSATNGNVFDQNRAYASIGYRFSRRYDVEAGYMNQFVLRNASPNTLVHIVQIAFYSRL